MKQEGKFILLTLDEFKEWLIKLKVERKITLVQNHHTYLPDYKSWQNKPDHLFWMRSMERFHLERGFSQIAQQITTFPDGMICIGRPFEDVPAGIKGANANGICMEHFGNFDIGGDNMSTDHSRTIVNINAALCRKFKLEVNSKTVVYHHWYNLSSGERWIDRQEQAPDNQTKTCPGTNFFGGNKPDNAEDNFYPLIKAVI